ncbi:CHAT domain-containing protein [Herpetosiphon llansteffanensis]|uniref:CHAT domain-containing protein n=1 Tax=Herpetosiphon llansteffanensis TaxID=2094568 RepID=UPI001F0C6A0A|nr:CHAT domain-containing protein [Herpetosiphon llansteffanensis]
MSSAFVSFHLTIAAPHGDRYPVTARTQAGHEVSEALLLPLDDPTLTVYQTALDYHTPIDELVVIAVGQLLYCTLFQGTIAEAFATARTHADQHNAALRIQLAIDTDTRLSAAAALPWELMATAAGRPLMLEHSLVRTFPWNDPIPDLRIPHGERIRLAVTSALPAELANHPIAAEAEVAAIRAAIAHSARPIDLIEVPHLTRERLTDLLTNQRPHIVHHIGHGSIQRGMGYLEIERADQSRDRLSAREFSTMLHQSGVQLVVLNACHTSSAGESLLTNFAPIFITDRIPAVIGMQTAILNRTGHCFANAFYATLGTSGSIDQALITARKVIHADGHEHGAWGFPTLYSRVPHGQLWQTKDADHTSHSSAPTVIQNTLGSVHVSQSNVLIGNQIIGDVYQQVDLPEAALKASLAVLEQEKTLAWIRHAAQQIESDRLYTQSLDGFVGRIAELADIRKKIETIRPTGGYVIIKALAGEGKSSVIAKLIHDAGIAQTPHHFIELTTGHEYQLKLLHTIVAQLILKHNLSSVFALIDNLQLLKGIFFRLLDYLSKQGIQETIYVDGLDQLKPESDGSRDLSFLPPQPPPGIVIVLGSRQDETLILFQNNPYCIDYHLPPLSEIDAFSLWRASQPDVADRILNDLYTALKGNALFVHLAANTMRNQSVADVDSLIKQIKQNPNNLFGVTLERIKRMPHTKWDVVWKPMLALLLVTQEPLQLDVMGDLLNQDHDTMQDAIDVLGGLVSKGNDHHAALHHLLFRDYLVAVIFNEREVKRWQQRLADWCAKDIDTIWADDRDLIEQARRMYARHHYITHLFMAENWTMLWQVLDAGDYGEQKTRFDPSTRLYALDLDRGRESAIQAGQSVDEHIQNLPRLWKYSLLRTSLTSYIDQWPDEAFEVLAMLGRTQESLDRIELVSNTMRKIQLWGKVIKFIDFRQQKTILLRMRQYLLETKSITPLLITVTAAINTHDTELSTYLLNQSIIMTQEIMNQGIRVESLIEVANTAAKIENIDLATKLLNDVINIVLTIEDTLEKSLIIKDIANAAAKIENIDLATKLLNDVINIVLTIEDELEKSLIIEDIAAATAKIGNLDLAINLLDDLITLVHMLEEDSISRNIDIAAAKIRNLDLAINLLEYLMNRLPYLKENFFYDNIISSIVIIAAMIGEFDRATMLINMIHDKPSIASIFIDIAIITANNGNINHAMRFIENATTHKKSINRTREYAEAINIIARTMEYNGDIGQANELISTIENPLFRSKIIASVALSSITSGNFSYANTLLGQITKFNYHQNKNRSDTLTDFAIATAIVGNFNTATMIAKSLPDNDSDFPPQPTTDLSIYLAIIGHFNEAIIIANSLSFIYFRAEALMNIASIMIQSEDVVHATILLEQAVTLLHKIGHINSNLYGFTYIKTTMEISLAVANQGDFDQAIILANTLNPPCFRTETLTAIANIEATNGGINNSPILLTQAILQRYPLSLQGIQNHNKALVNTARTAVTNDNFAQALAIAKGISDSQDRVNTLIYIFQTNQFNLVEILSLQDQWYNANIQDKIWKLLSLALPLLKDYPWFVEQIIKGEGWVNTQLKRLG